MTQASGRAILLGLAMFLFNRGDGRTVAAWPLGLALIIRIVIILSPRRALSAVGRRAARYRTSSLSLARAMGRRPVSTASPWRRRSPSSIRRRGSADIAVRVVTWGTAPPGWAAVTASAATRWRGRLLRTIWRAAVASISTSTRWSFGRGPSAATRWSLRWRAPTTRWCDGGRTALPGWWTLRRRPTARR